ncbi:hypothetical protein HHK36_024599 [Tetracentron sinense]|uniref:Uncharacterized protein n=1 Tax=Tetracentron sinense TaxID=13715 RepID=A0A835D496_TETSI|nr:hypothetical protein HHK36_024599 [Tetracentron sinense]
MEKNKNRKDLLAAGRKNVNLNRRVELQREARPKVVLTRGSVGGRGAVFSLHSVPIIFSDRSECEETERKNPAKPSVSDSKQKSAYVPT